MRPGPAPPVRAARFAAQLVTVLPLILTLVSTRLSTFFHVLLALATPLNVQLLAVNPWMCALDRPLTSNTFGAFVHDEFVILNGPNDGGWLPVWLLYVDVTNTTDRSKSPLTLSRLMFLLNPPRSVLDFTYSANFVAPTTVSL